MSGEDDRWIIGQTEDIKKHYALGKQLGQPGQFGCAYLCTLLKDGSTRAVKVISKAKFRLQSERQYHYRQLRDEIKIMKSMKHPSIIHFHDVYEDSTQLFIVMECCAGGELFDRIKEQPSGSYTEKDAAAVLRQIAEGIAYMHQSRIAHCDLKPDNFLFVSKQKDSQIKIIDFGMSKMVERRKYLTSFRGTPYYVAPEVLDGKYSEHCDMWSFGVIMFVMLFGYPPFHAQTDDEIFARIKKGFNPITQKGYGAFFPSAIPVSDSAKDLIKRLLNQDIARRYTAAEALEHPWLTGRDASSEPMIDSVLKNLQEFTGNCKFKNAVLNMMTNYLSETELEALKATFKAIDKNGDGSITADELKEAVSKATSEADKEELAKLIKVADIDGDGCLSYQELVMTSVQRKLKAKEERLWNSFCEFDLNRDGKVSVSEIEQVLGKNSKEAREIIAEVDKNGDGEIDYDEFVQMWMAKTEGA